MAHCYADNITRPFWPKGLATEQRRNINDEFKRKLQEAHWQIETLRPPGITLWKENGEALAT
jgi:hypothetical protein